MTNSENKPRGVSAGTDAGAQNIEHVAERTDVPTFPASSASRVALVTGGSRGIGRAICVALAQAGCSVAINYAHSVAEATRTKELCQQAALEGGWRDSAYSTVSGDVASVEACEQLYAQTSEELGAPDILVNNAGITRDNLILRMSVEEFETVMEVNLRAAFILSKLAVRPMLKKRSGRIINITSVVGIVGNPGQANYAASKAGMIGLTKTLAKELGSRAVTVNAIAPGFIETSMTDALSEEARQQLTSKLSIQRLGTPRDIASLVAFLAGENASYITGQVISVDGGLAL